MKHELLLTVDRELEVPLNRQIYECIRTAIHSRILCSGDPLPPSRKLARRLGISRSVILQSYGQLQAEGYVEMRQGAGTFVAEFTFDNDADSKDAVAVGEEESVLSRSSIGELELSALSPEPVPDNNNAKAVFCDFRHGVPAWDAFPMEQWQKALLNACRRATPDTLGYGPAEGSLRLRQEIARMVRISRSIPATPEQIVITSGATQALDLLARLFLTRGDGVVMEDPSHHTVREIFRFAGGEIMPVRVDGEGMCVDEIGKSNTSIPEHGQKQLHKPKLVYVTPSHQFPFGSTMSLNRRMKLLNWAKSNDVIIIEDDYDSEYRYVGPKLSALAGLDSTGGTVYVGSFSKILFPALRIGYIILPPALIPGYLAVKWLADRMSPALDQEALAEFIGTGHYARHVARMNKLYSGRRACLLQGLKQAFGDRVRVYGEEAGLHVLVEIDSAAAEDEITEAALQLGVRVYPASSYFASVKPRFPSFVLGYSNLTECQMKLGITALAKAEEEASP